MGSREVIDVGAILGALALGSTGWTMGMTPGFSISIGVGIMTGTLDVSDPDGNATSLRFVGASAGVKDNPLKLQTTFELSLVNAPSFAVGKVYSNRGSLAPAAFSQSLLVVTDNPAPGSPSTGTAVIVSTAMGVDRLVDAVLAAMNDGASAGFDALFRAAESVAFVAPSDVGLALGSIVGGVAVLA